MEVVVAGGIRWLGRKEFLHSVNSKYGGKISTPSYGRLLDCSSH